MRILLVGAGAVGVYFGSRLAQGGAEVSVVVRNGFDDISREGYLVESIQGDYRFRPAAVYRSASEYPGEPDWIIASTKVLPEIDLPAMLRGAVHSDQTSILLIQNGIDIEKAVMAAFPSNPVYHAVAYIGTYRKSPGVIVHQGSGNLTFGRNDGVVTDAAKALSACFARASVEAEPTENIRFHRWKKLLWNAVYNPMSVAAGCLNTREMCDHGPLEALALQLMAEVTRIAAADGCVLPPEIIQGNLEYTRNFPPFKSSMLVDYESGRPLELDAIVGNVLAIARTHAVAAPHLETMYTLLCARMNKEQKR